MDEEPPLACDLTAIDEQERRAHRRTAEAVFAAVQSLRERPNGYALRLPPETDVIEQAGAFVARERLCCPFFEFTLHVTPDGGPVWLNVTGGEDVKAFLEKQLAASLQSSNP